MESNGTVCCSVCLEDFSSDNLCDEFPCGHRLCKECYGKICSHDSSWRWDDDTNSFIIPCPMCRQPIAQKEGHFRPILYPRDVGLIFQLLFEQIAMPNDDFENH